MHGRINIHRANIHSHWIGLIQHGNTPLSTECQGEDWLVIIQMQKFSVQLMISSHVD